MQLSSRQNFVLKKKKDLHRLAEALQITGTLKCYQGTVFLVWYWNNSREILACNNNNNNGNNFISVFPRRVSTWYYLLFYIIFHRRTDYFLPGGAANHLPKTFLQVAQMFPKQSNRNEGRCNNIGRTGMWKWLDTLFQGQYLPSLSISGCNDIGVVIATKGSHYLLCSQQYFSVGTVLPKSITGAFSSNSRLDVREVKPEYVRGLSRYFGIKFLPLEIR